LEPGGGVSPAIRQFLETFPLVSCVIHAAASIPEEFHVPTLVWALSSSAHVVLRSARTAGSTDEGVIWAIGIGRDDAKRFETTIETGPRCVVEWVDLLSLLKGGMKLNRPGEQLFEHFHKYLSAVAHDAGVAQ
jgi:hypothetical protein